MKRSIALVVRVAVGVALISSVASARPLRQVRTTAWSTGTYLSRQSVQDANGGLDYSPGFVAAPATTSSITYSFNSAFCTTTQGWTAVDLTAPTSDFVHVDDFAAAPWSGTLSQGGTTFSPISGAKSLWIAVTPPGGTFACSYATLPGYGNGWNQSFCSVDCFPTFVGSTSNLDVSFKMKYDTESSYDGTSLEFTTDCGGSTGWTEIDGGVNAWSGPGEITVANSYSVGSGPVKIRFRFTSDASWSSEDGCYNGFGVAIDDLQWESLAVEDFEGEAVGSHTANSWTSCNSPGYGNYFALFKKAQANYEDPCRDDLNCYWAAISGSTEFYSCGVPAQPSQKVVPHVNVRGEYIANEIWSPQIAFTSFTGTGNEFRLRYTVYRDLPLDNMMFSAWHVRTIKSGCPGPWKDAGFLYFGDAKDWGIVENDVGTMLDPYGQAMQVAIGVVDMCGAWCGFLGSGSCHSPAPYIDQVKILRINAIGPVWDVRDVETFNDTFAADGTITGTARADIALDIAPVTHPTILPGDSAVVMQVVDHSFSTGVGTLGVSGLSNDPNLSTFLGRDKDMKAAYMWVSVRPFNLAKTGAPLSEGPGGQANRYPFSGTAVACGVTWTRIRMDYTYLSCDGNPAIGTGTQPRIDSRFCVDLNDNLFTPGDTILYFYSATSPNGTTYFSPSFGTTTDPNVACANAQEFTILPAGGYNRGGNILYVDGADGSGMQQRFDGAFMTLNLRDKIDRFDVRGAYAAVSNRPGGRVSNVADQLNACYKTILWDCGDLSTTLGDGSGNPEKTDDYALLNVFLSGLTSPGGVYLCGDDVACALSNYNGASAVTFRGYIPFTLLNCNHRLSPTFLPISPNLIDTPGAVYTINASVFGGCQEANDFDVLAASGPSVVEMRYNTSGGPAAALSNITGNARVVLGGYSFGYVIGGELPLASSPAVASAIAPSEIPVRAQMLYDMLVWFNAAVDPPTGAAPSLKNSLAQNYPNPFNPQTTIGFSLKARGPVTLKIYNVAGQLVRTLANESMAAGSHAKEWDSRDDTGQPVSSGVYFYQLKASDFSRTKKMVLLK